MEKYKLEESCFVKSFVLCVFPVHMEFLNRSAFPNRFKKMFLRALSGFFADLIIFSENTGQENLDSEIMKIGRPPLCSIGN